MSTILERILETKRREVEARRAARGFESIERAAAAAPETRDFARALAPSDAGLRIIAEVKKASPSKGVIRADFDPVAIARAYEDGGAAAISVLTDEPYFQGRLEYLDAIRREVGVPLLCKDFIVDRYQVYEARASGADAILLIVAALDDDGLGALGAEARRIGLDVLWEVHDIEEARRVRAFSPRIVGVNNRDLRTFAVSLETTRSAIPELPTAAVKVSESGFFRRSELEAMRAWGVDAFLIGESLMRADDPTRALRELVEGDAGSDS